MSCLTAWYTRKELAFRTALLYCGSLISGAFSGLIAAGITAEMDGKLGIAAWRWLFIIEGESGSRRDQVNANTKTNAGAITVAIALIAFFILPDFPANTKWIQGQERDLAKWRLVKDVGEDDWTSSKDESFFLGFQQSVSDYKTWFLVALIFGAVSSGTISSYFPTVVSTLGYKRTHTLLLTAPPYLLACIVALLVSLHADKTGERYFHFTIPLWTSIAGFIISAATTNLGARYFSMMIMLPGVYTAFTVGLTWAANTLPRPPAKRAASLALCNCIANCSSIYGPFLYPAHTAPRFLIAMSVNAGTSLMSIGVATVFRFVLIRLNRKLDFIEGITPRNRNSGTDETDVERDIGAAAGGFRYLY